MVRHVEIESTTYPSPTGSLATMASTASSALQPPSWHVHVRLPWEAVTMAPMRLTELYSPRRSLRTRGGVRKGRPALQASHVKAPLRPTRSSASAGVSFCPSPHRSHVASNMARRALLAAFARAVGPRAPNIAPGLLGP